MSSHMKNNNEQKTVTIGNTGVIEIGKIDVDSKTIAFKGGVAQSENNVNIGSVVVGSQNQFNTDIDLDVKHHHSLG